VSNLPADNNCHKTGDVHKMTTRPCVSPSTLIQWSSNVSLRERKLLVFLFYYKCTSWNFKSA